MLKALVAKTFDPHHRNVETLDVFHRNLPTYHCIGVAPDNLQGDAAILRHAAALANANDAELILIHVVDGVVGHVHGDEAADDERRMDEEYLSRLQAELTAQEIDVITKFRFGNPAAQIIEVAKHYDLDVLVLGSHRHGWFAD